VALIPDAHPGYIGWEQYETNQKLLLGNAQAHGPYRSAGPAREGPALLQGLAICGRCGRRMTVRYHTRRGVDIPDYQCVRASIEDGARRCQTNGREPTAPCPHIGMTELHCPREMSAVGLHVASGSSDDLREQGSHDARGQTAEVP
jgi:Recombinase zinc beta ribbon domain